MNTSIKHSLVINLLLIAIMNFSSAASADDKWCSLEATSDKTYVYVSEMDEDGANETRLWEGWIEQVKNRRSILLGAKSVTTIDWLPMIGPTGITPLIATTATLFVSLKPNILTPDSI